MNHFHKGSINSSESALLASSFKQDTGFICLVKIWLECLFDPMFPRRDVPRRLRLEFAQNWPLLVVISWRPSDPVPGRGSEDFLVVQF